MSAVEELIKRAAANVGSEYQVAKILGQPQTVISDWKHERRTCTPEDRARLAALAGEDAVQELVRATLEKHAGSKKGEQLLAILGKSLRVTGEATVGALVGLVSAALLTLTTPMPAKAAAYDVYYVNNSQKMKTTCLCDQESNNRCVSVRKTSTKCQRSTSMQYARTSAKQ